MLEQLSIKNFALIESCTIDWAKGLNTITGETGAGKSILLGALNLVCGGRFEKQYIHDPEKKCVVEAQFRVDPKLAPLFASLEVDFEEETIVRREISISGKSRAFINDTPVQVQDVKKLVGSWVDIHSQFNTMELKNPDYFLTLLDDFGNHSAEKENFQSKYTAYLEKSRQYKDFQKNKEQIERELNFKRFQYTELKGLSPTEDDVYIEGRLQVLNSLDQVRSAMNECLHLLTEMDSGLVDRLGLIISKLRYLSGFSEGYAAFESLGIDMQGQGEDLVQQLTSELDKLDVDDEELAKVTARFDTIQELLNKYQLGDIPALISIYQELSQFFSGDNGDASGSSEQSIISALKSAEAQLDKAYKVLFELRKKSSTVFCKAIIENLIHLQMPDSKMVFEWHATESWQNSGKHNVEVVFSSNQGFELLPIYKIASGGELSRIMLSIKKVAAEKTNLPTLVLDEIDTGVSGNVALKIGELLEGMGQHSQIIAITHLPQVASKGSHHLKVLKTNEKGKARTQIVHLNQEQRVEEIAGLISGAAIENSALEHAKVLLNI
ncbi:MAG: DNA repair protein RecN (Recombination protein N) [Sphingobacteriales bacterium]|jgi:DNA repair protein RecN (Recombination protein N)